MAGRYCEGIMNRCTRCLMPDSRPDTEFVDGVCSACIAYEQREEIDWATHQEKLEQLLDRHRGKQYDCIVPSSGGKDSHYIALTLIEMGVRPLVVTATTCHLTPIGRANIANLGRYADTLEITPHRDVRRKLNRLALRLVGDISWPEHVLIHTVPFKVAVDMGISLVFYGENPLNQYGGPRERQAEPQMTRRWVQEFGGFLGMRPQDFVGMEGITERDMLAYMGPTDAELHEHDIEVHFLGQYLPWDSHHNAEKAVANGFRTMLPCEANWWDFENLDNAQTGIHDHMMYLKYGYGRGCAQLSVDIRAGRIDREKAQGILDKREGRFPWTYAGVTLAEILDPLDLMFEELKQLMTDYGNREPTWDSLAV